MNSESYADLHRHWIIPTTIGDKEKVALVRGHGVWVWDENGKKYFGAGSQVSCANIGHNTNFKNTNIGHNHPKFASLMKEFWAAAERNEIITTCMGTDFFYLNRLGMGNKHDYYPNTKEFELSPVALAQKLAPHLFGLDNTIF